MAETPETRIRLTNSLTRTKEDFVPIDPDDVRMYVCGPTVYDRAHLGNARPVVVFDVLFRLLRHVYGADHVTYVRNFTDVDDKINARAAESGRPIREITDETTRWFLEDMGALGALEPTAMPRATEWIGAMIAVIERLIASGHAYEAEGHVMFAVESYREYGKLSGRSVEDMIAGARVEVAPYKRNPMDFVLWKPSTDDLPGWDSPWGRGRPGWHIECSAMAHELLGESFDIHGGGADLMFPHHENEIAQSCCAFPHGGFARVWLHNEMLQVEGRKMSKSLGNFFTVRELIEEYRGSHAIENIGPAIRLRFLQTHYRSPVDISRASIERALTKLDEWTFAMEGLEDRARRLASDDGVLSGTGFLDALSDDLNTSGAITWIDRHAKLLLVDGANGYGDAVSSLDLAAKLFAAFDLLGIDFDAAKQLQHRVWSERLRDRAKDDDVAALIEALLADRAAARKAKDFARADALRDGFAAAGVLVKDTAQGAEWELAPGFDAAKLEALR